MKYILQRIVLAFLSLTLAFWSTIHVFAVAADDPVYTTLRSIDLGTFNEYRYRVTEKFFDLREYFEVNRAISVQTLQEMAILANTWYKYLPDNLKNKNYLNELLIDIQRGVKNPSNEVAYTEIIKSLAAYLEQVEISSITGEVQASPIEGNAPLSVTFRGKVQDPTGTQIKSGNYTWWIDDAGERVIIGRGTSLNYTFRNEWRFSVFLDVTSSHKNEGGYTDVLPYRSRTDITVNEKIASVILKVNGNRVGDSDEVKFTPEDANYGLIFDATSSTPSDGTKFTRTEWDFGNGITRSYSGGPKIERVRYGREWDYTARMKLTTNEGKTIEKSFNVYVHDPIATVEVNKLDGYIGDKFTFTAKSSGIYRDLTYNWEIINIDTDEILISKTDKVFTYAFTRKGKYNVRLRVRRSSGEIDEDTRIVYVTSQSPIAEFSSSKPFDHKPNRVLLDASRSHDPDITDDGNLKYSWFINGNRVNLEESNANGSVGYYVFDSIGSQSVSLEVTDPDGITSIKKGDVQIDSILAVEMFAFPRVIQRESFIKFVAESPEAEVYEWDFGDGEKTGGSLDKVTHTYDTSGTFNVKLTVSDGDNNTNSFTRKVYVSESDEPLSFIGVSYGSSEQPIFDPEACNGVGAHVVDRVTTYKFDGSESINIDGKNAGLEYSWKVEQSKFSTATNVSHRFDEIGCFPIKLTVKSEQNGKTDSSEVMVDVRNVTPIMTALSIDIDDPELDPLIVRVSAEGARDPDGVIQSYLWYYYTDVDQEPQDFRSTTWNSTAFVIPKITGNYYFVAILKDNNEARVTSEDVTGARFFTTITGDNINTPIVELQVNDNSVEVGEEITFNAKAQNILGQDISKDAVFSWDFDGDGFYDTQTNDATTSYSYKKSGEFYAKVKVKYRGISSTKNVTMNVSNKLIADFGYIAIWSKFIFFDSSSGGIESRSWDLWDGTKKSGTYFEHTYTDKLPTHEVTLKISEWSKSDEMKMTVQKNIKNILKTKGKQLVVFSSPVADENDIITLEEEGEKVFIYLWESAVETQSYAIDYDIEQDSDLNGGSDDDENNLGSASYNNGDVIEIPLTVFKTQKIRVFTKDADGNILGTQDITIEKAYVEEENIDPDSIIFEGVSESEKDKIDTLKEIISELPQQQKLVGMSYIRKLQENWNDSTEKTRTILDFENYIFELGLEETDENNIISLLESLLVEWQEDQSAKQITYQALVNLIPSDIECSVETGTCYDNLISKLEDIKNSNDIEINKALWSEILSVIAWVDDEQMTQQQKLDFKAILTSLVYGGDVNNIPDAEKEEVIGETPDEWDSEGWVGILSLIVKVLGILILIVIGWITLFYIYYLISGRNKNGNLKDFISEKTALKNDADDVLWGVESKEESSDILSSASLSDPLMNTEVIDPLATPAENSKKTVGEEVPAWLKGNFAEEKKTEIKKPEEKNLEAKKDADVFWSQWKVVKTSKQDTWSVKWSVNGETKPKQDIVPQKTETPKQEKKVEVVTPKKDLIDKKAPKQEIAKKEDFDIEAETALPKTDDNVPDWLKGSFDTPKVSQPDIKEENKEPNKENSEVKVEVPKVEKKEDTINTEKKLDEKTVTTPLSDENVPDWLKGSFDEMKTEEAWEAQWTDNNDVKVKEEKISPTKTPIKKDDIKKVEAKKTPEAKKVPTKPKASPKKTNDFKWEAKEETPWSTKNELWDDGMKIPDWLKGSDEK